MNLTPVQALESDILTALIAEDGPLDGAKARLFKSDTPVTPTTPLGAYTTADYTGYADKTITWSALTINDLGGLEIQGVVTEFRPTADTVGNVIYGLVVLTSGGALRLAGRFDNPPLPMNSALDNILPIIIVRANPLGGIVIYAS